MKRFKINRLGCWMIAVSLLGLLAAAAQGDDGPTLRDPANLKGVVVSVSGDGKVTMRTGMGHDAQNVVVVTDAKTVVTLDGQPAKATDLKPKMWVTVTPADGTATRIEAASANHKPKDAEDYATGSQARTGGGVPGNEIRLTR